MKKSIFGLVIFLFIFISLNGCSVDKAIEENDEDVNNMVDSMEISLEQERIIQIQSFTVGLNNWGNVEFVSYQPDPSINFDDVHFYLVKDNEVIYEFPYYCENNNTSNYVGQFDSVESVGVRDINNDGKDDIVVIINYVTGTGSQGMVPRPTARIFLAEEAGFYVEEDMMTDISDYIAGNDLTVDSIYQCLLSNDAENSAAEAWQDAYKDIIRDRESYLVDPYDLRSYFVPYIYIGVHDFDHNGNLELIIGDGISAAIFTYEKGKAEKVADLYEPDYWGAINRLSYKNNCIVIESHGNGSGDVPGGNGYVCFTYEQGEYISGFYCDYEPEKATINEKPVSEEEFRKQFNLTELRENSKIEYSKINEDNEITLAGCDESIAIEELDLRLIEW